MGSMFGIIGGLGLISGGAGRVGAETGCVTTGENAVNRWGRGIFISSHQRNSGDGHEKSHDSYYDTSMK
jgi:hypothetical protein